MSSSRHHHLVSFFQSKNIAINHAWLTALLSKLSADDVLPTTNNALEDLAVRHFLHSNIRQSVSPSPPLLPGDTTEKTVVSRVLVQIVDCQEVGSSLSQQLDKLEAYEERQKPISRRLIRLPDTDDHNELDDADQSNHQQTQAGREQGAASSDDQRGLVGKKMVKVVLEDAKGNRLFGIDQKPIDHLYFGMPLGAKLFLIDVTVVYGVLILRPTKIEWLGGTVNAWNSTTGGTQQQIKETRELLKSRLDVFPIMNSRQRQEASLRAAQDQEAGGGEDELGGAAGDANGGQSGRGGRGRGRGRGERGRGQGNTRGTRRGRGRGA